MHRRRVGRAEHVRRCGRRLDGPFATAGKRELAHLRSRVRPCASAAKRHQVAADPRRFKRPTGRCCSRAPRDTFSRVRNDKKRGQPLPHPHRLCYTRQRRAWPGRPGVPPLPHPTPVGQAPDQVRPGLVVRETPTTSVIPTARRKKVLCVACGMPTVRSRAPKAQTRSFATHSPEPAATAGPGADLGGGAIAAASSFASRR